jgi:hypothetical protein
MCCYARVDPQAFGGGERGLRHRTPPLSNILSPHEGGDDGSRGRLLEAVRANAPRSGHCFLDRPGCPTSFLTVAHRWWPRTRS